MVRCINAAGEMLGVMQTRDAFRMAQEQDLDLVEISPNAEPPVCRIMDLGKFLYSESLKKKQARKQAMVHNRVVKEMKYHSNVEEHDYQTKLGHIREFLTNGHKVKITLQFRGRENAHRELGMAVVNRVLKDCDDIGMTEMDPRIMGRSVMAILGVRPAKTSTKKLDDAPAVP
jgi:translation initiation factor IF-3